jgi:hypothetical protein
VEWSPEKRPNAPVCCCRNDNLLRARPAKLRHESLAPAPVYSSTAQSLGDASILVGPARFLRKLTLCSRHPGPDERRISRMAVVHTFGHGGFVMRSHSLPTATVQACCALMTNN